MKEREGNIGAIVSTILVVALALFAFTLYQADKGREEIILTSFTDKRYTLVGRGLSGLRQEVDTTYAGLFEDCEDRNAYNAFIATDSRTMTASELREALLYHDECGQFFVNKTELTLGFFEKEIDSLRDNAILLKDGKQKEDALQIVEFWEQIFALEGEHGTIYKRLVDIQEEYWSADLNKAILIDTPEEREAKVGALNNEANQKLGRIEEIQMEIERFQRAESTYWEEHFATSTAN